MGQVRIEWLCLVTSCAVLEHWSIGVLEKPKPRELTIMSPFMNSIATTISIPKGLLRRQLRAPLDQGSLLIRTFHDSAAATVDMTALPGVLGSRTLRRTVQVRLGFESLRLPGGTVIFTISQHRIMKHPG